MTVKSWIKILTACMNYESTAGMGSYSATVPSMHTVFCRIWYRYRYRELFTGASICVVVRNLKSCRCFSCFIFLIRLNRWWNYQVNDACVICTLNCIEMRLKIYLSIHWIFVSINILSLLLSDLYYSCLNVMNLIFFRITLKDNFIFDQGRGRMWTDTLWTVIGEYVTY